MANTSIAVVLRPVRAIKVKIVGSSQVSSDFAYFQKWLELDAGNPFSRYSDDVVVNGGGPSDV